MACGGVCWRSSAERHYTALNSRRRLARTCVAPRGHIVDRDAAAVLNMLWKITPEGAAEAVW